MGSLMKALPEQKPIDNDSDGGFGDSDDEKMAPKKTKGRRQSVSGGERLWKSETPDSEAKKKAEPKSRGRRMSVGSLGASDLPMDHTKSGTPPTGRKGSVGTADSAMKSGGGGWSRLRRNSCSNILGLGGLMSKSKSERSEKDDLKAKEKEAKAEAKAETDLRDAMPEADEQFALIERFRKHLLAHFGSAVKAFESMDENGDGDLTFEELLNSFDLHNIPEGDSHGNFDLRRIFLTLDIDGSNALSCDELMSAPRAELVEKMKNRKPMKRAELTCSPSRPPIKNTVERLRRLMLQNFATLKEAFKAMDRDGSGELSFAELKLGMASRKITACDELGMIDVKAAFKTMDVDNSGEISMFEFQGFFPNRKKKAAKKKAKKGAGKQRKTKQTEDDEPEKEEVPDIPQCSRPPGTSPAMQKIELFGPALEAQNLNLKHCCVGEWGAVRLAYVIHVPNGGMRMIKLLQLEGNYIGDAGVIAIADTLETCCALSKFVLSWNGLGDASAKRLAETTFKIGSLVDLVLANNHIGDEGALVLAEAVSKKPRPALKVLDLRNNRIGIQGTGALHKADHEKLKLKVEGNRGEYMSDADFLTKDELWGEEADYPLNKSLPLLSSIYSRKNVEKNLSVDLAATLSMKESGNSWLPSMDLTEALAKAKAIGNGEVKKERRREDRDDAGLLSGLAGLDI